jgi:hypothetical protein
MNTSGKVGDDLRGLAYRLERYLRLEATEHLTVVTTYVVLAAVTFALATSAIFFLSTGLVKSITILTGNEMVSYYIVGGVLVLVILLFFPVEKDFGRITVGETFQRTIVGGTYIDGTDDNQTKPAETG